MNDSIILKYVLMTIFSCCLCACEVMAVSPSFDCEKVEDGSIEERVCKDDGLAALDNKLAEVYAESARKAFNEHPPILKTEQCRWIKVRNECWKTQEQRKCVEDGYLFRIAELQARYRLVAYVGPVTYLCNDDQSDEVVADFFQTDPPTLIAESGDKFSLMYLQPSGSGSKYLRQNEMLWEHHDEALIRWGYGKAERHCKRRP